MHVRDSVRQIKAMQSNMPDLTGMLTKPILPKANMFDAFPMVKQIEKPEPPVATKASAHDLLYKM